MNATKGLVVPTEGGQHLDMAAPGRFAALKLLGHETNGSIMLFEETVPAGTKSLFHLHRDSDEVAWVLAGEITFKIGDEVSVGGPGTCAFFPRNVPHAWKNSGSETGRVLFLYTPASAGGYVEELLNRPRPISADESKELRERYRWEVVGPNPLGKTELSTLRLMVAGAISPSYFVAIAAIQLGFFQREGIDVEFVYSPPNPSQALKDGTIDFFGALRSRGS